MSKSANADKKDQGDSVIFLQIKNQIRPGSTKCIASLNFILFLIWFLYFGKAGLWRLY